MTAVCYTLALSCELGRRRDSFRHQTASTARRFFGRGLTGFVVFGIAVHLPEIVELRVGENVFHAQHRSHHGVILVVVFVCGVAADEVEIWIIRLGFMAYR